MAYCKKLCTPNLNPITPSCVSNFSLQYQHIFKQKVITQKISISEYNKNSQSLNSEICA